MADESIVIEIKDNIPSDISAKIKRIATDARESHSAVQQLQKILNAINGNSLKAIQAQSNSAAAAVTKLATANQGLATAQQKTATATAQAAAAQSKATTAATQAQTAQAQLAAATARTQAAQDAAALAAMRLATAQERATARAQAQALAAANVATAQAKLAVEGNKSAQATDRAGLSVKQYNNAMRGVPAQITDIVVSLQGGQRPLSVLLQQGGQLKDMFGGIVPAFKALALGVAAMINPFTVAAAAIGAFAVAIGMVESKMRDLNALSAQFKATGRDIDGSFIVALRKELEVLPGVSRSAASEIIKAFADVRTVGATNITAASKIVRDLATAMGVDTATAAEKLAKALDDPVKGMEALDKQLGIFTPKQFKAIDALTKAGETAKAQAMIIDILTNAYKGLTNDAMTPMQRATDRLGNAWNKFVGELSNSAPIQAVTGLLISLINTLANFLEKLNALQSWKPPGWVQWMMDNGPNSWLGDNVAGLFGGKKAAEANNNTAIVGTMTRPVNQGSQFGVTTDTKLRQAGLRGPKGDKSEENRAAALAKINAQLDNQIKLMSMLGPEREKQEMFDRIEEGLLGRKIKLTSEETRLIKEKIDAIVSATAYQAEFNRVYEEAIEPARTYYAASKAIDDLEKRGAITDIEANRQRLKTFEIYANIVEPLREYNKQLDEQLALSKMTAEQGEIESQIMGLNNTLLGKGIVLRGDELKVIRDRLKAIQDSTLAQQAENAVLAETVNKSKDYLRTLDAIAKLKASGAISSGQAAVSTVNQIQGLGLNTDNLKIGAEAHVEVYRNMYAQIKSLLDKNLIDEQDASNLRLQVWMKEQEQRLNTAQSFFGGLANLQSSSNKKLAAIGRAAAISNAIIDTYKSATGAYAAMSAIPYVGPALGAAAAAAAIAAGLANVAKIRSQGQGYQSGGYTGDGAVNQVAGVVHGKEFVVNADATAANRPQLEAMNRGATAVAANSGARAGAGGNNGAGGGSRVSVAPPKVDVHMKNVNVFDPSIVGDYLGTPEGEQVLVNIMQKNSGSLNAASNV